MNMALDELLTPERRKVVADTVSSVAGWLYRHPKASAGIGAGFFSMGYAFLDYMGGDSGSLRQYLSSFPTGPIAAAALGAAIGYKGANMGNRIVTLEDQRVLDGDRIRALEQEVEDLSRAKDQAEQENDIQSRFMASMSHELRTPLNAIIGFSESIMKEVMGPISKTYQGYATDIHNSGVHLLSLINDILDLKKVKAGKVNEKRDEMSVEEIVGLAVSNVRESAVKNSVRIRDIEYIGFKPQEGSLTKFHGYPRRAQQVMINLLTNSVKYMDTKKTERFVGVDVEYVSVKGVEYVKVGVYDNGKGMDKKGKEKALEVYGTANQEPLSSGKDPHAGVGLGIPIVMEIMKIHNGIFEMRSTPGKGTRVDVYFPLGNRQAKRN